MRLEVNHQFKTFHCLISLVLVDGIRHGFSGEETLRVIPGTMYKVNGHFYRLEK